MFGKRRQIADIPAGSTDVNLFKLPESGMVKVCGLWWIAEKAVSSGCGDGRCTPE
jgi:hypothetical protein